MKYGTTGDLTHWNSKNKVQLGIYFFLNAEVMSNFAFILLKMLKKSYPWAFILLKMLKEGTAGDLFQSKGKNEVRLKIYFSEKVKNKVGLVFYSM